MDRFGRVLVLAAGFGTGIAGSTLVAVGAQWLSTAAVVLGFVFIGGSIGTVMLSRVAAADMYPPQRRAWGISLVLFGAVFGAILGPFVFMPLFAEGAVEAGSVVVPWVGAAGFMTVGLVLVLNVRPDPQRIGRLLAAQSNDGLTRSVEPASSLAQILRRPGIVPALLGALTSFSVMVGMMTLAGYVMVGHGHHPNVIFPVISAHFVGMFGLVLVVGNIVDRLGRIRALVGGLLLVGASILGLVWVIDSVAGTSVALFGIGLGWSLSYVAATAELGDLTNPTERGKILGFNDLLSGLLGAALAILGGVALTAIGLLGLSLAGAILSITPIYWIVRGRSKPA